MGDGENIYAFKLVCTRLRASIFLEKLLRWKNQGLRGQGRWSLVSIPMIIIHRREMDD
jgi:hypothetical protein